MHPLDDLNFPRVDFIKADVEGMEYDVVVGGVKTIRQHRPTIFLEANSLQTTARIVEWARGMDYVVFGHVSRAFNPDNFNRSTTNMYGEGRECGLLLIHRDRLSAWQETLSSLHLHAIETIDDLALLLLHKPQYVHEVLAESGVFGQIDSLNQAVTERDGQIDCLNQVVSERDGQIASLSQAVTERDGQNAGLNQAVAERDGKIASLSQTNAEHEAQIASLNQSVTERDGKIASLSQAVTERDGQIAGLNQAVAERDGKIASLSQTNAEHEAQIASLNQSVTERDGKIASLSQAVTEQDMFIQALVRSKSWLITKPIRWVGRVLRGDFMAAMDPIRKALNSSNPQKLPSPKPNDDDFTKACESLVIPAPIKPTHPVAVILPIYRNVGMTKRCILSAMPGILAVPDARIIAINDASPDADMQEMLEKLASQWPNIFVLLRNEKNLGFVGTVNRGLAYFSERDVALLNSDVIVPQDWLARLIEEAYSRAEIGTVTPFSNNATICSFPNFVEENSPPFNLDVNSIDAAFRHSKLACTQAPTGVGFCMYIRRSCLDVVGYLNQEKFGRGYGEENDLCQRALKSGWLNIISPNLYAHHEGGVSFSSDKQALVDRAMRVIDELHPGYHASVQRYIALDPLKRARTARHIQLLAITAVPKILHISHAIGGGVGQHIEELAQFFSDQAAHILLTPHGEDGTVSISLKTGAHSNKILFQVPKEYGSMIELLKFIGVGLIHIHHTLGLDSKIFDLHRDLNVPYILTVHDFYMLNGNPTLTDENGRYPGFYSKELRNPLYPLPQGVSPESWQEKYRSLIDGAKTVIFPSFAARTIFNQLYRTPNSIVAPHVEPCLNVNRKPHTFAKKRSYTIGILGAIGREKGADLLEEVGQISKSLNLPLKFKLLGYAYRPLKVIETSGPYKPQDLSALIQKHRLDIIFFPAQWPETYSYTLSYALDSGLPIIAPNIGAFPERLSGRSNTFLFNHLTSATDLVKQINNFLEKLSFGASVEAPIFGGDRPNLEFYCNDYIQIAPRNSKIVSIDNISKSQFIELNILSVTTGDTSTWRNSVTRALWRVYMNPAMRWVNYVVPYSARRFIKRSLIRSPIHNVINKKL